MSRITGALLEKGEKYYYIGVDKDNPVCLFIAKPSDITKGESATVIKARFTVRLEEESIGKNTTMVVDTCLVQTEPTDSMKVHLNKCMLGMKYVNYKYED